MRVRPKLICDCGQVYDSPSEMEACKASEHWVAEENETAYERERYELEVEAEILARFYGERCRVYIKDPENKDNPNCYFCGLPEADHEAR